jgi:uncharacterized protein YndB with AHSA1/START domain
VGRVQNTQHIDAPPEIVWRYVWDATMRPQWEVGVLEVKNVQGALDQVGGRWTEVRKTPILKGLEGEVQVTRVDPGKLWEVQRIKNGKVLHTVCHTLEPEGDGTRKTVESTFEPPGGPVGRLIDKLFMGPYIERHSSRCEANLKALAEAEARGESQPVLPFPH